MRLSEPRVLLKWELFNWRKCSRLPQVSWRKQGGCLAPQTQSLAGRWPVWLGLGGGVEKPRQVHRGSSTHHHLQDPARVWGLSFVLSQN